jgi:glutathionylspermidine synthase
VKKVQNKKQSRTRELGKKSQELFDHFDSCAMRWGWTQDQGYGSMVDRDQKNYDEAKEALIKHIARLERVNKDFKKRLSVAVEPVYENRIKC